MTQHSINCSVQTGKLWIPRCGFIKRHTPKPSCFFSTPSYPRSELAATTQGSGLKINPRLSPCPELGSLLSTLLIPTVPHTHTPGCLVKKAKEIILAAIDMRLHVTGLPLLDRKDPTVPIPSLLPLILTSCFLTFHWLAHILASILTTAFVETKNLQDHLKLQQSPVLTVIPISFQSSPTSSFWLKAS